MSCPAQSVHFNIFDNVRLIKQLTKFMILSFPPHTVWLWKCFILELHRPIGLICLDVLECNID
jgi:hypothetical protein